MTSGAFDIVSSLATSFEKIMQRHLPKPAEVALIGYPNHPNVGDSAIWLGELAWLRRSGHRLSYAADIESYSRRTLNRAVAGDAVILLHGGGNLGDIWPYHQALRERVMHDFPRRRIIQLPQTAHFHRSEAIEAARAAFQGCSDLLLIARDADSLRRLDAWFDTPTELAPDPAFSLGHQLAADRPSVDCLWLTRTDTEAIRNLAAPASSTIRTVDWLDDDVDRLLGVPMSQLRAQVAVWGRRSRRVPPATKVVQRVLVGSFNLFARRRFAYGLRLLAQGRIVVSDRLHAHVLALLLGIPNVVVDTGYGKLESFWKTWTSGCPAARFTRDAAEAPALAQELTAEYANTPRKETA
jgi:exopolysaccharide biosynthesis predicted pyruvyltransferase EpsI